MTGIKKQIVAIYKEGVPGLAAELFLLMKIYLIGVLIYGAFRLALLVSFGEWAEISLYKTDLLTVFWVGYKFDTMILLYLLLPAFLLAIIFSITRPIHNGTLLKKYKTIQFWCVYLMMLISIFLLTGNYYFFKFFHSSFNILVFGIIEDDTLAVLKSFWTDYPILWILSGFALMAWALHFLLSTYIMHDSNRFTASKPAWKWITIGMVLLLYPIGMRGTFEFRPIRKDHTHVSTHSFLNRIVPNGIYSLLDARKDHKKNTLHTNQDRTLSQYGFQSIDEVLTVFTNQPVEDGSLDMLYAYTPESKFLQENPPHVVFILMESMSTHYFDLHSEHLNLLGKLEEVLPEMLLFRNFLPSFNGTIFSLENLIANSVSGSITRSPYYTRSLPTSTALPYYEKGYHTAFVTGARLGWRNLGEFIGNQHFSQVEGDVHLLKQIPNAEGSVWGVYDHFMFERMYQILEEQNTKGNPAYVFGFSTTNHTPFELPSSFTPQSIVISDSIKTLLRTKEDIAQRNFTAHQYSKNALGEFILRIKESDFGHNTIIVATGDHNAFQLFNYPDEEMFYQYSVPLLMYIPEAYLANDPDTQVFASHKDIFPTLYQLSLSQARYVNSGVNLLSPDRDILRYAYAVNACCLLMNPEGIVSNTNGNHHWNWNHNKLPFVLPGQASNTEEMWKWEKKLRSYCAAMTMLMQKSIAELQ